MPPLGVEPSIAINEPGPYTLGDTITYTVTVPKIGGNKQVVIETSAYQDVDGNGDVDTNVLGPDVVFTELDWDASGLSVVLGGHSSIWTLRGGPAECRAELQLRGRHSSEPPSVLASVTFHADG